MLSSALFLIWLAAAPEAEVDATQEAVEIVVESARRLVPAKQIERGAPSYPRAELRKGNEAWVHVAYCIDESGRPQNVSVLDSVGASKFDDAAVEAVRGWKFEPALIDGEPSWQSRNAAYINFALSGDNRGASKRFASQFRKLGKLIDRDALQEADELFRHVYETYDMSLYELAKLWAQRVRYEGKVGDMQRLDVALHRATAAQGEWIDKKSYARLLSARVQVELNIGQYDAAQRSYKELIDATGDKSEKVLALRPTMDRLQDMIDGDDVLQVSAKVRAKDECNYCNDSWHFTPVRKDISFANISGKLTTVEMSCDHKRFESTVSDLVEWHIPDSWGTCHVQVYGEPGTTFDVLMMPAT